MLPVPSSMLSAFRMGVMAGPLWRLPRSVTCQSFIRLPSFRIQALASAPPSVNQ